MTTNTILVNFNIPNSLNNRFSSVCKIMGKTKTSIFIQVIEQFVISAPSQIERRNETMSRIDDSIRHQLAIEHDDDDDEEYSISFGIFDSNAIDED